ncbi:MAG TPA: Maf family protein [Candidatus Acidoferrum sp.]|nr:Maf family protein [Candidatus Acidoferrum sp.]
MSLPEIILASASPRRAALLAQVGLPFLVLPSTLDEDEGWAGTLGEDHEGRACRLALAKAQDVAAQVAAGLVIGADTIVVCDGIAYGKPRNASEARETLTRLAGRTHQVVTAVAIVEAQTGRVEIARSVTLVRMRSFESTEVAAYVATGEPLDKAGAYAIQGRGALLVEGIEGEYSTVVGLPLPTLARLLRAFGVDIWQAVRHS